MTLVKDGLDPVHSLRIPDALRVTEKTVSLILVRGSQSCLSWYIVSLAYTVETYTGHSVSI